MPEFNNGSWRGKNPENLAAVICTSHPSLSLHRRILAADVDHTVEQHCAVEDGSDFLFLFARLKVSIVLKKVEN